MFSPIPKLSLEEKKHPSDAKTLEAKQSDVVIDNLINIMQNFYLRGIKIVPVSSQSQSMVKAKSLAFLTKAKKKLTSVVEFFKKGSQIIKPADNPKVLAANNLIEILNKLKEDTSSADSAKLKHIEEILANIHKQYNEDKHRFGNAVRFMWVYFNNVKQSPPVVSLKEESSEFESIKRKLNTDVDHLKYRSMRFEPARLNRSKTVKEYGLGALKEIIQPPPEFGGEEEDFVIQKIESLENKELHERYERQKEKIKNELAERKSSPLKYDGVKINGLSEKLDHTVNEVFLYHGTSWGGSEGILTSGFNSEKFSGHSKLSGYGPLGRGTYFTDNFLKAGTFAMCALCGAHRCVCRTAEGLPIPKVLLISRVVLGDAAVALDKTTHTAATEPPTGFHSIVGFSKQLVPKSQFKSTEVSIANDLQIYPQYRVYYHHSKNLLKPVIWMKEAKEHEVDTSSIVFATFNQYIHALDIAKQKRAEDPKYDELIIIYLNRIKKQIESLEKENMTIKQGHFFDMLELQVDYYLHKSSLVEKSETESPKEKEEEGKGEGEDEGGSSIHRTPF